MYYALGSRKAGAQFSLQTIWTGELLGKLPVSVPVTPKKLRHWIYTLLLAQVPIEFIPFILPFPTGGAPEDRIYKLPLQTSDHTYAFTYGASHGQFPEIYNKAVARYQGQPYWSDFDGVEPGWDHQRIWNEFPEFRYGGINYEGTPDEVKALVRQKYPNWLQPSETVSIPTPKPLTEITRIEEMFVKPPTAPLVALTLPPPPSAPPASPAPSAPPAPSRPADPVPTPGIPALPTGLIQSLFTPAPSVLPTVEFVQAPGSLTVVNDALIQAEQEKTAQTMKSVIVYGGLGFFAFLLLKKKRG